jgi:hypothetical protein
MQQRPWRQQRLLGEQQFKVGLGFKQRKLA